MPPLLADERRNLAETARRMVRDGLVIGTAGNLSVRNGDLVAVTPSAVDYDALTPDLIGVHDLDGAPVEAAMAPTSELPMHLAVYRAQDAARAVVHTHALNATAVSTLADALPPVHYLVALFGGPVRVAPYRPYGTQALADAAAEALITSHAVLLGNHGTLVRGGTLPEAYDLTRQLEWLCELYLKARAAGTPRLLTDEQIAETAERLHDYVPRSAS
jgi:L-fuculose-phosphate aldolase